MNEETIKWILTDTSVDPVSKVPTSAVVFMLYYGLELKHFLLKISDDIVGNFNPGIRDYRDSSLYLAGSAAQGFYLNTNDFLDARDIDIVSILRKEVRNECEFDKKQLRRETENVDEDENQRFCKGSLKENSTAESPPAFLNVETWEDTYPGYVMLRKCRKDELPVQTSLSHRYVSSLETTRSRAEYWNEMQSILADVFRSGLDEEWGNDVLIYDDIETQGPAASSMFTNIFLDVQLNADLVFALPYPGWPEIAKEWENRITTSGWPSSAVKQDIIKSGCLIVPKGQLGSRVEEYEWRISFSFAELKLSRTLNHVQREIVHVFKAFLSDKNEHGYLGIEAKLDSYFVINLLYTESEQINPDKWTEIDIAKLVFKLLDKLESSIRNKKLPHYFIPANNLLHRYTFDTVKLSKGEFKRGYGENEMMNVDEYIDFALYAVLRLRHDPLEQVLSQSKYVQLTGSIRRAVFEPLVTQAKDSSKVEGKMYFLTVLRLAKAHLFQLRFREAYLYTEDSIKFYKALGQTESTEDVEIELKILKALTAYLAGNYNIAKDLFEEIENDSQTTKLTLLENHKDIFFVMYARTLFSFSKKYARENDTDIQSKTEKVFRTAVDVSSESSRPVVYFDLLNYFMISGRYEEAGAVLNEVRCLQAIEGGSESSGDTEFVNDTEKSQGQNRRARETPDISFEEENFEEKASCPPKKMKYCPKDTEDCDVPACDTQSDDSGSVEIRDLSTISSDEGVVVETGSENAVEIIYNRKREENDYKDCDAGDLCLEEETNAKLILESIETTTKENANRAILNLYENQDLLNQFSLFQAFKKLDLNENADRVYQKLLHRVQERHEKDNSITVEALEHDYMFYKSIKVEESVKEDWENPFTIFKELVVISKADEYIIDDILKSLVERYSVVRLTVSDLYFHYRVQLLKYEDKVSVALALIGNIKDQDLVALHYQSLGDKEKAEDADFYARLNRDGGGKSVAETLKQWTEKMLEAARKYEPRNVYLDTVFS